MKATETESTTAVAFRPDFNAEPQYDPNTKQVYWTYRNKDNIILATLKATRISPVEALARGADTLYIDATAHCFRNWKPVVLLTSRSTVLACAERLERALEANGYKVRNIRNV